MTDTGQIPAEGLPENAGNGVASAPAQGQEARQGAHAPGAHPHHLDPSASRHRTDDVLLMPGAQGPWGDAQPNSPTTHTDPGHAGCADLSDTSAAQPVQGASGMQTDQEIPGVPGAVTDVHAAPAGQDAQNTPGFQDEAALAGHAEAGAPVPSNVHGGEPEPVPAPHAEPGAHETAGRDSGSLDVSEVRNAPVPQQSPARRPLHLGPLAPDPSASLVRSLSDRGPAGPPSAPPQSHPAPAPATGPASHGAPAAPVASVAMPIDDPTLAGPQLGALPPYDNTPWSTPDQPENGYQPDDGYDSPAQLPAPGAGHAQAADGMAADVASYTEEAAVYPVDGGQVPTAVGGAVHGGALAYAPVSGHIGGAVYPQGAGYAMDGVDYADPAGQTDGLYHGNGNGTLPQYASGPDGGVPHLQGGAFVNGGGFVPDAGLQQPVDAGHGHDGFGVPHAQDVMGQDMMGQGYPEDMQDASGAPEFAHAPQVFAMPGMAEYPGADGTHPSYATDPEAPSSDAVATAGQPQIQQPLAPGGQPTQPGFQAHPGGPGEYAEDSGQFATADGPGTPQPVGQFVPVEGSVPTTPHLAPTPPHALTIPQQLMEAAHTGQPTFEPVLVAGVNGTDGGPEPVHFDEGMVEGDTVPGVDGFQDAAGYHDAEAGVVPQDQPADAGEVPLSEPPAAQDMPGPNGEPTVPTSHDDPRQHADQQPGQHSGPEEAPESANAAGTAAAAEAGVVQDSAEAEAVQAAVSDQDLVSAQLPAAVVPDAVQEPDPAEAQDSAVAQAPADLAAKDAGQDRAVAHEPRQDGPTAPEERAPALAQEPAAAHATSTLAAQSDDSPGTPDPTAPGTEPLPGSEAAPQAAALPEGAPAEATSPSVGPPASGYDEAEREAVLRVMRERRDIRNGFRSDPIPHDVLLRVLEAAHTAPSVGHSQPWDFVVIRSEETRRTMHELAVRQREAYAKSLPKGRAKQFKELKIEAILDTPVNIVVTADRTRGGRHTLGRHTQPQMAPYSSALAVENLWLAARAEGLGVGWVSFFDEREMVRALGLPEHLDVVAYLCVGYVDEFPDEPELVQSGWSKRRPLSWVVHDETYGRRALPGSAPHDLLAETVAGIRPLDAKALGEAWDRQKRMTKPSGALGMLEIISAQLSGLSRMCPPPIPEPAVVAIFAGDHGVHAQGVTPWPQEVTGQMVANFLGGGAVCNAFAAQVGAEVCVIDVGVACDLPAMPGLLPRKVRAGTADMTTGPALTREEVKAAIEVGIETARDLVAAGNKALLTGEMGIANTTVSAALDRRLHRRGARRGDGPRHRHQRRDARPQDRGRTPGAGAAPAGPDRPDRGARGRRRSRTRGDCRPAAGRRFAAHPGRAGRRECRRCSAGGPCHRPRGARRLHRRTPQRRARPRGRPHQTGPAPPGRPRPAPRRRHRRPAGPPAHPERGPRHARRGHFRLGRSDREVAPPLPEGMGGVPGQALAALGRSGRARTTVKPSPGHRQSPGNLRQWGRRAPSRIVDLPQPLRRSPVPTCPITPPTP